MYNDVVYNSYFGAGDIVLTRDNASATMKTLKSSVASSLKTTSKGVFTTPWATSKQATVKTMPKTFLPSADVARKLKRETITIDYSQQRFKVSKKTK